MNGKYIVLEGLEGAGKTSAKDLILDTLKSKGITELVFTREPGGTSLAEKIRELMLKSESNSEKLHSKTETLLFYASRAQLIETVVKPALKRGVWVVSDRHDLSTQAYQGGGRGIDSLWLKNLRYLVLGNFFPDLTIYLDVPSEVSLKRTLSRGNPDRIEQESLEFFDRTRRRYLDLASSDLSIRVVDANQPMPVVLKSIKTILINWIKSQS